MKVIIFGITGQDGYYLSELLKSETCEVIGVSRNSEHVKVDVADFDDVSKLIKNLKPDYIFHFAANSTARHDALFENHNTIATGTLNILESVRLFSLNSKVFLSGSALQFKNVGEPINENTPFDASSPYALSRIHSVYAGRYYRNAFGIKVYTGYFFNHDSPLRTERHVNQKITSAVKRIAGGSDEKLILGNLDVKKEFNFAGDIVKAVWMFVNQSNIYETVIGSGDAHSIREWLEYCFSKIGKNWKNYVEIKKGYLPEYNILVCDPYQLKNMGWQPEINFTSLADMMIGEI